MKLNRLALEQDLNAKQVDLKLHLSIEDKGAIRYLEEIQSVLEALDCGLEDSEVIAAAEEVGIAINKFMEAK